MNQQNQSLMAEKSAEAFANTNDTLSQKHSLPPSLTTVTPLSKLLALSLFIIVPIVAAVAGVEYGKSLGRTEALETYGAKERSLVENTEYKKNDAPRLVSPTQQTAKFGATFQYDDATFIKKEDTFTTYADDVNGESTDTPVILPSVRFSLQEGSNSVLDVIDFYTAGISEVRIQEKLAAFSGVDAESPVRDITVNGHVYSFSRYDFFEGFPTNEEATCFAGGGVHSDVTVIEGRYGVILSTFVEDSFCEGEEKNTVIYPDAATQEQLLRLLESLLLVSE